MLRIITKKTFVGIVNPMAEIKVGDMVTDCISYNHPFEVKTLNPEFKFGLYYKVLEYKDKPIDNLGEYLSELINKLDMYTFEEQYLTFEGKTFYFKHESFDERMIFRFGPIADDGKATILKENGDIEDYEPIDEVLMLVREQLIIVEE
ncbi:MAG: hypothetical protein GY827_04825 [Cytophagales bacterium]|nr:hypothetical protein [Cytophagales bacterium]